ncbi:hypothetical protein ACFL1J_00625 [Pseudomonadota bacterium]
MKNRFTLLLLSLFFSFTTINVYAHDDGVDTGVFNKDGSYVTGVLTASFDPFGQSSGRAVFPTPSNLAFFTTTDMTLDIPVDDPTNTGDPLVALSSLDGWSLTEKWVAGFANNTAGRYDNNTPGSIDPTSVTTGQSVRVFEVTTSQFLFVTSIVRELTPGVDYFATAATASQIAILPLKPLKEYTAYMAVFTNDINDTQGNDATPDRTYGFGKTSVPWVDANGHSTNPLFDDATAQQLELIRQVVQSMELNAAAYGIDPADIVLAWTAQTQSVTRTLKTLKAYAQPSPTQIGPTNLNTHDINPGWPGLADIYAGIITLPYYSDIPTADNPSAQLTSFWQAEPGAYVPPFDQFGLDPTSTHVTIANPIPIKKNDQTVPIMVTVPNASSGNVKPANGWPVVIYGHGITRNRTDVLAVADTLASIGYATVAIDFPLHGVSPDDEPHLAPFWIENTPFAPIANERTFDADFLNNATLTFGPDGLIDPSGYIVMPASIGSMQTGRDSLRQGIIDLVQVAISVSSMDIDFDTVPDLDASNMGYVGVSWGSMHGTGLTALEPLITRAFLSVPGGGIARFANASPWIGPIVQGVFGQAGLVPGTAEYEQALLVWQTLLDAGDPINWAAAAAANTPIMLHEVIDDQVIPNYVPFAPLSGTEPMIAAMGLNAYSTSQASPDGLRSAARFLKPATHTSLLSPNRGSPEAFAEMQKQMASFIASHGGAIMVTDESTMVPVMQMQQSGSVVDLTEKKVSGTDRKKSKPGAVTRKGKASWLEVNKRSNRLDRFE